MRIRRSRAHLLPLVSFALTTAAALTAPSARAAVTYQPYVQLGDASAIGDHDQVVIAWQTDDTAPRAGAYFVEFESRGGGGGSAVAVGRVINDYLAADPTLPVPPAATGPRVNYYALLTGLELGTEYTYRVFGPGLPARGFRSAFHTRSHDGNFSFLVQGDEGFFPAEADPTFIANFEARIVHEMNDVQQIHLPGEADRPDADFALICGDNVYTFGSEDAYRDFWMPVWNNEVDSNETGAPFIRRKQAFIVIGNHDVGSTGVTANLLGSDTAVRFDGNQGGGNALVYYNHFYYPLNGPTGVDPQFTWNADSATPNGFVFQFKGSTFTSPAAIEAFRASTAVATRPGEALTRQIDHTGNYSFDEGNAHFLFLDANPHLFDGILDGASVQSAAPDTFPSYPSVLRKWVIDDLDGSRQTWKIVVFHQPAFSSGLATLRNSQMRAVAKVLEDHGANMVFQGHEHNYQRTRPLRALATVAAPASVTGGPAVAIDDVFDGVRHTTPDGVLYLIEGAGGNRDFDGDEGPARGSGTGLDQDDSATGTFAVTPTLTVDQGPASWLDTNLTDTTMGAIIPGAGTGPKITVKFKSKVFSFGQVVVHGDELTLFQISEPLQDVSTATSDIPAPFGTDVNGRPLNNPIADTLVDPTTGDLVSAPATGTPALLDKFTIRKADLDRELTAAVSGPNFVRFGDTAPFEVHVTNRSRQGLVGAQVVFALPEGTEFAGTTDDQTTVHGRDVVVTIGRLAARSDAQVWIPIQAARHSESGVLTARAVVRSSNAQTITARPAFSWQQ